MSRAALTRLVIALGVVGLIAIGAVLTQSWRPTSHARDLAVVLEAPPPSPGTYTQHDMERARILLVRDTHGVLSAYVLPLRDGKVALPDIRWWRPAHDCVDFRAATADGTIDADSLFECHDQEVQNWSGIGWRWSIDGHHIRRPGEVEVEDLVPVKFEDRQDYIRIYRSAVPW